MGMEEFPPPQPPTQVDADRAARLAALASRRSPRTERPTEHEASTTPDGRLAERLAALAAQQGTRPASPEPRPSKRTTARRHHPARGARVAALGLSLVSTGGLATLFAVTGVQSGNEMQAAQIVSTGPVSGGTRSTPASVATEASASTPLTAAGNDESAPSADTATPVPAVAPTTTPAPQAATTVVDGGVFHNKWGDVQVQATFAADGTLIDVTTLQTPFRDNKSVRINDRAVPQLNSEALTVQSASVDTVSGATYTSTDYRRSLQSAIDAAAGAGVAVATA